MEVYRLQGTGYEMGLDHGRTLATNGFELPPASPEKIRFANECEAIVQKLAPELLAELRGIAQAADLDEQLLKAFVLTLGEGPGCSVVAIAGRHTANGKPLFGRNFDFADWDGPYQQLYRTYPTNGLANLGGTDVLIGREDGINEAGLVMAQTHVAGHDAKPGVLFSLVGRMVLDRCRSVEEAVALLEHIPHVRANNWLLMDTHDTIAVVETSPKRVAATYAPSGFAVATNHFRQPTMIAYESSSDRPSNSEPRLCTLEAWFNHRTKPINREDLQAVLGGHTDGVCAHRSDLPDPLSTLRSLIASPGERRAYVTAGAPCRTPYELYEF